MKKAILASALIAAGCSWIVDPKSIEPNVPADAGAFCSRLRQGLAAKDAACLGADPTWAAQLQGAQLTFLLAGSADLGLLNTLRAANIPGPLDCAEVAQAQARGRIAYDKALGYDCLGDVAALTCTEYFQAAIWGLPTPRCLSALQGNAPTTGACHSSLECSPGDWCDLRATCPGTCLNQTSDTLACAVKEECYQGRQCVALPGTTQTTCQALVILGGGLGCGAALEVCDYDLYCPPAAASAPTCQARKAAGPCPAGRECRHDLACTGPRPTPGSWSCQAPKATGAACVGGNGECVQGAACSGATGASGACQQFPAPPGACGTTGGGEVIGCTGGSCDATSGTCRATTPC